MNAATERTLRVVAPVVVGLLLLALWYLLVDVVQLAPKALPGPLAVAEQFGGNLGIIWKGAAITSLNALVGLLLGTVLAIIAAALAAWARPIDGAFAPVVAMIAVVPIVALTPIFNTMFGASSQYGRQLVAAIAAFVPVYLNVLRGLRQARPVQRDLFAAYAASGGQTFRKLTLPTAVPHLFTGVRIASSLAVISALVAEYFGGPSDGVGTAIATYAKSGRAALAFAFVGAAIVVGLVFFLATALVERLVTRRLPG